MAISGDFPRLAGTIAALRKLSAVPSRVAAVAAPKLEAQTIADVNAGHDPYGRPYAPHAPATVKRWGRHPLLNLTGAGISSIRVRAKSGTGIEFTADEHMRFTQGGTKFQPVRAFFPSMSTLPKTWNRILKDATTQTLSKAMGGKR